MNINHKNNNFDKLLAKEKELSLIEKEHAFFCINEMSIITSNKIKKEKRNIFYKIKNMYFDYLDSKKMIRIKKEAIEKYNKTPDKEKENKILKIKEYKENNISLLVSLEKINHDKHLIADCGGISFPIIEYDVYVQLKSLNSTSEKHFKKTFNEFNNANLYYKKLVDKYNKLNIFNAIEDIVNCMNNHITKLKDRIKKYESQNNR